MGGSCEHSRKQRTDMAVLLVAREVGITSNEERKQRITPNECDHFFFISFNVAIFFLKKVDNSRVIRTETLHLLFLSFIGR